MTKKCKISHYLSQNWKKSIKKVFATHNCTQHIFLLHLPLKIGYIHNIHWCKGPEIKNKEKKATKRPNNVKFVEQWATLWANSWQITHRISHIKKRTDEQINGIDPISPPERFQGSTINRITHKEVIVPPSPLVRHKFLVQYNIFL